LSMINLTYIGWKNIVLVNNNLSLINQLLAYPYNDVKNQSVILASNVNNYSRSLAPNEIIEVSNICMNNNTGTRNITCGCNMGMANNNERTTGINIYTGTGYVTLYGNISTQTLYKINGCTIYVPNSKRLYVGG